MRWPPTSPHLTEEQWNTQSLCDGWTVKNLVAHMTSTAQMNPLKFFGMFAMNGFNMAKMQAGEVVRLSEGSGAAVLGRFNEVLDSESTPPGPVDSWLGEAIVHAEDIRRPLGIEQDYPIELLTQVLDFYKNSNLLIGTKSRIAGVQLKATDTDWSFGEGPAIEGQMLALLMAATGRREYLNEFTSEGLAIISGR
ncbi:maleylpyruvate isomerase family mycothiol-dependent enzyme [Corynebacterium epidermidicanis]|uniref:Mycothiol-dependent maleylpyruvate isomerase metal-binding domain-containing protein n=1 Tax=Corynebacterium epidermidicanis TaxID=1050174 RepID=A0A0G3GV71_9CORY|nr:maleylpyruvate isomerase family mycothiol-dependent enzyme [Corynebacterium epidermidicanis]AKK02727.1 hypothetical protein CEPID_04275 [Corynebacterium epidermidicanis]